jgi:hypothetical protein
VLARSEWTFGVTGQLVYLSPHARRVCGFNSFGHCLEAWFSVVHPDDLADFVGAVGETIAGGGRRRTRARSRRLGFDRYVVREQLMEAVRDPSGVVVGVRGSSVPWDIRHLNAVRPRIDNTEFVSIWAHADSLWQAAALAGLSPGRAADRAERLRDRGVGLVAFSPCST